MVLGVAIHRLDVGVEWVFINSEKRTGQAQSLHCVGLLKIFARKIALLYRNDACIVRDLNS